MAKTSVEEAYGSENLPSPGQIALACAARGWRVITLNKKGQPNMKGWPDKATINNDVIERWFTFDRPGSYCGIATGFKSGIWVLDIDVKNERNGIEPLKNDVGLTHRPDTFIVTTPSGGEHWYFTYPNEGRIGNKINVLPGLDTRGEGGQVVAPYTRKPTGVYTVLSDRPVTKAPKKLEELGLASETDYSTFPIDYVYKTNDIAQDALTNTAKKLSETKEYRNKALFMAVADLTPLCIMGLLSQEDLFVSLHRAMITNGWIAEDGEKGFQDTFLSAWRRGIKKVDFQ